MRRRFEKRSSRAEEKKENLKAEMRIPGRRTTTFGFGDFDLDESNESEGVDSYAVEEPFSPSPKKRESRSAKRQKFSTDAVNNQATTSSARYLGPATIPKTILSTSLFARQAVQFWLIGCRTH